MTTHAKGLSLVPLALFLALLFTSPASAQVGLTGPLFSLSVTPRYPAPDQLVQITLQSSVYDLDDKSITWRSNGELLNETGPRVEVRAPRSGESVRVSATVEGTDSEAEVTIAPASVALMWEARTYAPGLYKGRHLPGAGATVTLQAMASLARSGGNIPSSEITYTWKRDGQVLGSLSGRGKSSITLPLSPFSESERFSVVAESLDKKTGAEASVTIPVAEQSVRLYLEHPLYGTLYHSALPATTFVADSEMSFHAVPYFVSAPSPNDRNFSYEWRVNRVAIVPNDARPSVITINAGGTNGRALIDVTITHRTNLLFEGVGEWAVTLGSRGASETQNGLFGRE